MEWFYEAFEEMYRFLSRQTDGKAALILLVCLGAMLLFAAAVAVVFTVRRRKERRRVAYSMAVFFGSFGIATLCATLTVLAEGGIGLRTGVNALLCSALALAMSLASLLFLRVKKAREALPRPEAEPPETVYVGKKEAVPPEAEDLIDEIDRISLEGASLSRMKEVAELLQKERMKPENQDSDSQRQLSTALSKLLKSMDDAINR